MSLAFYVLNIFCSIGWKKSKKRWPLWQEANRTQYNREVEQDEKKEVGKGGIFHLTDKNKGFFYRERNVTTLRQK